MRSFFITLVSVFLFASTTQIAEAQIRCITKAPPEHTRARTELEINNLKEIIDNIDINISEDYIIIPIIFHVLHKGDEGKVSKNLLNEQIKILNNEFNKYNIKFHCKWDEDLNFYDLNSQEINRPDLFKILIDSDIETEVKINWSRDTKSKLNFYIAIPTTYIYNNDTEQWEEKELLGFATFPSGLLKKPSMDGIVINYKSLPGGPDPRCNEGDTAVHECGHWLGLYHTFEGETCEEPGDEVDDTPQQCKFTSGCIEQDSCPDHGGNDPKENFMDYSDDNCMDKFTPGQIFRIRANVALYRRLLIQRSSSKRGLENLSESYNIYKNKVMEEKATKLLSKIDLTKTPIYNEAFFEENNIEEKAHEILMLQKNE
jgi:hypothetical protein